ncbi:TPA: hypothetical protein ACGPDU_000034 [Raoultella ornithinolytica]|nr:hypothetical protein [Raoultella ornithinolytica]
MTSKFTREELLNIIETDHVQCGEASALARMALAAMDSEPVAEVLSSRPGNDTSTIDRALPVGTQLYRHAQPASELKPVGYLFVSGQGAIAYSPTDWGMPGFKLAGQIFGDIDVESQPVPVVPVVPDVMEPTIEAIKRILPTSNPDEYAACIGADMWNACRAAMLQAGNSPVIPDGYVMVPKEPTDEMLAASYMFAHVDATRESWLAMLAAAPQEVKGE